MWNTSKFNAPISWEKSVESSIPQNIKHFRFLNDTLEKRNAMNLRISWCGSDGLDGSYELGSPDTWIIMERTSSDEIFLAVVLTNRWMERSFGMERSLGMERSFIKDFALHHKHVLSSFPIASTINPEVALSGLFSKANSRRNQVFGWFLMYLQVAIKFRIASTLENLPILSRSSWGSMSKAEELFDTEVDSETSIKGLNSICVCFVEEEALPMFQWLRLGPKAWGIIGMKKSGTSSLKSRKRNPWRLSLSLKHSIRDYYSF